MCFLSLQQDFVVSHAMRPSEFQSDLRYESACSWSSVQLLCVFPLKKSTDQQFGSIMKCVMVKINGI